MVNVPSPSLLQNRKVRETRGLEAKSLGQPAGATSTTSTNEVWASKLRTTCVEIKFYGAFALNLRVDFHAIDATPARWRGDVGSSPLDGASTAAVSPRNG